jgi:hypothetical protein
LVQIDREVLAFDEASPPKFIKRYKPKRLAEWTGRQDANAIGSPSLLRPCCERPRSCRAAKKRNKFPPPHARRPRVETTLAHGLGEKGASQPIQPLMLLGTSRTFADVRSYAASGGEATSTAAFLATQQFPALSLTR